MLGNILRIAVPVPVDQVFDYLPPFGMDLAALQPGMRLRVPFGRRSAVGMLLDLGAESVLNDLRRATALLDAAPVLSVRHLRLLEWASRYYRHPIGEVIFASLPLLLRQDRPRRPKTLDLRWRLTPEGAAIDPDSLRRSPAQATVMRTLRRQPERELPPASLASAVSWRRALRALVAKGWVAQEPASLATVLPASAAKPPTLNDAQASAVEHLCAGLNRFGVFLLDGVTGSGKTEVYLRVIEEVLRRGSQALVLVPEIGLTEQTLLRFRDRFATPLAVLHSGRASGARLDEWRQAGEGRAPIVIGTRSAVWAPLARPGVIIVDEEHDLSFKQQEGFRYSARDIAVIRGQRENIPVILGSATPSLESVFNVHRGKYRHLRLRRRAGTATPPRYEVVDLRAAQMREGFSEPLLTRMGEHLDRRQQVLLFVNRRGYAPLILCHQCGWTAWCERCDARLVYHQTANRLECHFCGALSELNAACTRCGSGNLLKLGYGTERVVEAVKRTFPDARVLRIDRDITRRQTAWQDAIRQIRDGQTDVLVGTQLLSKGHHFPGVTLVAVVDGDSRLFGVDFRSHERFAQQLIQVAGRAGRADEPGTVLIQTHHPAHPLLQVLVGQGYGAFAALALKERAEARLPPYQAMALIRAESEKPEKARAFLNEARAMALDLIANGAELLGPVPAPMERLAGRYRWQLVLQTRHRARLQRLLDGWLPGIRRLRTGRALRWSIDVDPQETL